MATELLDLGVLLLVKQLDDDAFIPVLWLHWYNVDCECACSASMGMIVNATNITKAIPNIFEIPILFMQFRENTFAFDLFMKGIVCKFI